MKRNIIIAIVLILSSVGIVSAQTLLSLEDAIIRGLENNYDIRIQKQNVQIAGNNNALGEAGFLPNVSINVNQNNSLTDNVKVASPFQLQGQIVSHSLNPQLLLNWQLFDGFNAHITKDRLETLQNEASGNADIVIANTIQAIALGYYRAALEFKRLEEFQRQLTLSSDRYDYIKIKADMGSAISTDKLLEETNYLTDSVDYINQLMNYENALRDLNFLMGEKEVNATYDLATDLDVEPQDYTYEELSAKMYDGNIDLKKQYLTQRILEYDKQLAKTNRLPSVNLNAGYSNNRSLNDLSNAYQENGDGDRNYGPSDPLTGITDNYFANFSISFTLFNGNRINRAIENALIRENIQGITTEKLENSLNRDLAKAVANYQVKKQVYLINVKKEEVARLNYELSEEKFKSGTINSFDFRTVQNNYLSASIQKIQSIYNLIDAEVSIARLTGDLMYLVEN